MKGLKEPDERVIRRAIRGEPAAFRTIVTAYQHKVHDLLAKMLVGVVSLAEVEELAQECFVKVYQALPKFEYRRPGGLTRWLLTMATRVGLDKVRKRRLLTVTIEGDTEMAAPAPTLDGPTKKFLQHAVANAVNKLPPGQRHAVVLRDYFDMDYNEIAEALEISVGTVKSRIARARESLRGTLKEENDALG